jgi:hypothetical protein
MQKTTDSGPIEVWIRQDGLAFTCTVVNTDESTGDLEVASPSLRGAEREMTGYFISKGYTPAGRWETTAGEHGDAWEVMRTFKPAS